MRPTILIARDKRVSERVSPPLCALRSQSLFLIAEKADWRQRVKVNRRSRLRYSFSAANQAVGKKASGWYCAFAPECRSHRQSRCSHVYWRKASGGFVRCKFYLKRLNSLSLKQTPLCCCIINICLKPSYMPPLKICLEKQKILTTHR